MKKRLTQLITQKQDVGRVYDQATSVVVPNKELAEHLIANGVIVPPCRVGNKVYRIFRRGKQFEIYSWIVTEMRMFEDDFVFVDDSENIFTESDIGKRVFLTRKDAEVAIAERITNETQQTR